MRLSYEERQTEWQTFYSILLYCSIETNPGSLTVYALPLSFCWCRCRGCCCCVGLFYNCATPGKHSQHIQIKLLNIVLLTVVFGVLDILLVWPAADNWRQTWILRQRAKRQHKHKVKLFAPNLNNLELNCFIDWPTQNRCKSPKINICFISCCWCCFR